MLFYDYNQPVSIELPEAAEAAAGLPVMQMLNQSDFNQTATTALSGRGQEATSKFSLEKGLSIFKMTHDGDSNFAIWLLDDEGDKVELLVNKIGDFDGSKAVGIKKHGDHLLDISADGRWAITIEQPRPSSAPSVPKALKGKGQQASDAFSLDKGLARFEMSHDGDSNFAIWLLDDEGDTVELLVNKIGDFDGSKAVSIRKSGIVICSFGAIFFIFRACYDLCAST
jgi:autonomous glycyl radical cofactor GrcA